MNAKILHQQGRSRFWREERDEQEVEHSRRDRKSLYKRKTSRISRLVCLICEQEGKSYVLVVPPKTGTGFPTGKEHPAYYRNQMDHHIITHLKQRVLSNGEILPPLPGPPEESSTEPAKEEVIEEGGHKKYKIDDDVPYTEPSNSFQLRSVKILNEEAEIAKLRNLKLELSSLRVALTKLVELSADNAATSADLRVYGVLGRILQVMEQYEQRLQKTEQAIQQITTEQQEIKRLWEGEGG